MILENNPEKALISSYIIKNLNRDSSAKVDRILKESYSDNRRNPLIIDMILRTELMDFFSDTGCGELSIRLMEYYRKYELYSSLMDAKNMLVISSKEELRNSEMPFSSLITKVVKTLLEREKGDIVKKHIKSALASCILVGRLGIDFRNLMDGTLEQKGLDKELSDYLKNICIECQAEIKSRLENSKPLEGRNKTEDESN